MYVRLRKVAMLFQVQALWAETSQNFPSTRSPQKAAEESATAYQSSAAYEGL